MKSTAVLAVLTNRTLVVRLSGKTFKTTFDTPEKALEEYRRVEEIRQSGDEEAIASLRLAMDTGFRKPVMDGLEENGKGVLFLAGSSFALPERLAEKFRYFRDNNLPMDALLNFTKLLAINPDKEVREGLFDFADNFKMPITPNGYFIAYKSVYFAGMKNKRYAVWLSQQFTTLMARGKTTGEEIVVKEECADQNGEPDYTIFESYDKFLEYQGGVEEHLREVHTNNSSTKVYEAACEYLIEEEIPFQDTNAKDVIQFAEGHGFSRETVVNEEIENRMGDFKVLGTLTEEFSKLPSLFDFEEKQFTDCHSRTMDIQLGKPVSMPREDCDNNPRMTCSTGLHVGAPEYVQGFGSHNSDRHVLACLVNPANVVAVPYDYSGQKMRTCEYLPYSVCEIDEDGEIVEMDTDYFEADYINYERQALEDELKEMDSVIVEEKDYFGLTKEELEARTEMLKNRIKVIS